ncbi:MAG: 2OG-Fe(II) oxygenase [Planctomycetota bacterium]|nr:2OG-Fe(II) oxygenase [Planctomycetota bacterium]MDG1983016.1 2OG-Fe(II) oxygenase [Planctomycetota bacterium]
MADPSPSVLIVDDFLDEEAWTEVWTHFQFAELSPVSRTAGAWKLGDGVPLGGDEIVTPARDAELDGDQPKEGVYPSGTALDRVVEALLGEAAGFAPLVGEEWAHVTARPYVYPTGAGLSWHGDDSAVYSGAYIYYAHPHWNAHWGGELLVADNDAAADLPIMGHRFDDEGYSAALMEGGEGRFILPRPNRLVVLGGAPHMVTPVRPAAGSNVRASVSGFFLREPLPEAQ